MDLHCEHPRTKIIARDGNVDYVECLDCKKVFEAEDLEPLTTEAEEEGAA
jgi:NAD-dependent SIR2 family protein deacetylase